MPPGLYALHLGVQASSGCPHYPHASAATSPRSSAFSVPHYLVLGGLLKDLHFEGRNEPEVNLDVLTPVEPQSRFTVKPPPGEVRDGIWIFLLPPHTGLRPDTEFVIRPSAQDSYSIHAINRSKSVVILRPFVL